VTSSAFLVLKGCGVVVLGVSLDPIVDTLPGYSEHAGKVGGAATVVELQDRQSTPEKTGVLGFRELTSEAPPLPRSQVEPAHELLLRPQDCK